MMKINLLKNRGSGKSASGETTNFEIDPGFQFEGSSDGPSPIIKLIVMFLLTGALFTYEWFNIGQLKQQLLSLNTQISTIDAQIAQIQPEVEKAKALQKDYRDFRDKVQLVKNMGRLRLREIRAMDHLQNVIPEKAWFSRLTFDNDRFLLEGVAANDQVLDALLEGIRRHSAFKDVLLAKAVEEKSQQGTLRVFSITSNLAGAQ